MFTFNIGGKNNNFASTYRYSYQIHTCKIQFINSYLYSEYMYGTSSTGVRRTAVENRKHELRHIGTRLTQGAHITLNLTFFKRNTCLLERQDLSLRL
jgi:hypothetical protein